MLKLRPSFRCRRASGIPLSLEAVCDVMLFDPFEQRAYSIACVVVGQNPRSNGCIQVERSLDDIAVKRPAFGASVVFGVCKVHKQSADGVHRELEHLRKW